MTVTSSNAPSSESIAATSPRNHEVDRPRKLLLHKRQIEKLERELRQRGTAAPILSIYFKGKNVKVEIGLAHGRRKTDKRDVIKERDAKRDMGRALRGKQ